MGKHPAKDGKGAGKPAKAKAVKAKAVKAKPVKAKAAKAKAPKRKAAAKVPAAAAVLDRLFGVVTARRGADPAVSHSARLLGRGLPKVAQKFGEEAVECLIEAVGGNKAALVAESADVLYHLLVMWVAAGVTPEEVWAELERREGVSGLAEKAARARPALAQALGTTKIP